MKKNRLHIIVAVLSLLLVTWYQGWSSTGLEEPDGDVYTLKNNMSTLHWKGSKPGGEHHGEIKTFNGRLETDGNAVTGGRFEIDMNTIVCKDLENEGMNLRLVNHLKSEDFFFIDEYPKAYFTINKVVVSDNSDNGFNATHEITGDLTIRGITHEITFPVNMEYANNRVYAKSDEIVLDRTRWNVTYKSKNIFKDLKDSYIDDEMLISLDLVFDMN